MDEENIKGTKHEKIFITEPMNFTMSDVEEKLDAFREIIKKKLLTNKLLKKL